MTLGLAQRVSVLTAEHWVPLVILLLELLAGRV